MYGRGRHIAMLTVLALAVATAAGAGSPGLSVGVPPRELTVGDHLAVRITAEGSSSLLWGTPKVVAVGEGSKWAVVQGPRAIPQAQPPAWDMVLAPLGVGKLELPALLVSVRDANGSVSTVTADHLPVITVETVLPPGQKVAPAALDDPVGVTGFPWEWISPVGAALFPLALLGLLLWWLRRKRRRVLGEGQAEIAPLDEMLATLGRVEQQIGRAPLDEICDQLSGAVRWFVERRTGAPAMEMTTFELTRLARRNGWPSGVQRGVQDALGLADAVRFARRETAEEAMSATVRTAGEAASVLDGFLTRLEAEGNRDTEGAA